MPSIDLHKDVRCASCGEPVGPEEIVEVELKGKPVWSGCVFCLRLAVTLAEKLPGIIGDAIATMEQRRCKDHPPLVVGQIVEAAIRERMKDLYRDGWRRIQGARA